MPIFPSFFVNKTGAYEIEQSLRFNSADSTYLYRIPGSSGNRRTWTLSFWFKRGKIGTDQQIFSVSDNYGSPSLANYFYIIISGADNKMYVQQVYPTFNTALDFSPNGRVFRDPSAWYHVVLAIDTTQATGSNRQKMWINGELQTLVNGTSGGPTTISQNYDTTVNTTEQHRFGLHSSAYFDGYLAEVNLVDGSALTHEDFGELDDNGVWRPIQYAGSYTGSSFYLKFDAADVDGDSSGLGNDFTAVNVTTSGTGTDVMSDTPTNNYATLNPLRPSSYGSVSLSNGNLNASQNTTAYVSGAATIGVSSGKWYWEVDCNSVGFVTSIGITKDPTANGIINSGVYTYHYDGVKYVAGTATGYGASYTSGDLLGFALDLDAGTLVAYKNGTSQGTLQTGLSGTFFPYLTFYGTHNATFNFGQTAFQQTVPTGYSALNTSNLPAPDIADGSDYFNTILYSGDESSPRALTGVGFQPDFVWIKCRNLTADHNLNDAVRGTGNVLATNKTASENNDYGYVSAFSSDGFSVSNGGTGNGEVNSGAGTYAAWNWLAGGSGSSNTDGSITSTVSANPTAGFSIVSFNSGASGAKTVGHGLGVAPQLIITKDRDNATNWTTYHASATTATDKYLNLNGTAAVQTASGIWGSTLPTSTVFGFGSGTASAPSADCIAYCFAEVENYSRIGSYVGNGSSDGPFVYCGFKPRWILTKSSTLSGADSNWRITDTARNTYNLSDDLLWANLSSAGGVYNGFDICSNGFKIRTASNEVNSSGQTYIFAAFAENPFGGSGVSPATAR